MLTLAYLFLLHWIGDFVFQTRWMATNKSENMLALTAHVGVYVLVFFLGMSYIEGLRSHEELIVGFCFVNFVLHWLTDLATSQITKYFKEQSNDHAFFATIGFDQLIHQFTIMSTYILIIGYK